LDGDNPDNLWIGDYANSYAFSTGLYACYLDGELHQLELPEGAIEPKFKANGIDVYGCGLVLDPEDKLCIFFTLNGNLLGELVLVLDALRINKKKSHVYFRLINYNINRN
jgi:hypothetical protein